LRKRPTAAVCIPAVLAAAPAAAQTTTAEELMEVDRAFNTMAEAEGLRRAFTAYAADDAILLRQGNQMPVVGRAGIAEIEWAAGSSLSWTPTRAEIAASKDLGYTFGSYKVRMGAEIRGQGVYVTIWRKQPDGSWKYVVDGGSATPAEPPKP
jgi:ketosteroid isomerase-like protein